LELIKYSFQKKGHKMIITQTGQNSFKVTQLTLGKLLTVEYALEALKKGRPLNAVEDDILISVKQATHKALKG
jgi:hypothetical protein